MDKAVKKQQNRDTDEDSADFVKDMRCHLLKIIVTTLEYTKIIRVSESEPRLIDTSSIGLYPSLVSCPCAGCVYFDRHVVPAPSRFVKVELETAYQDCRGS